MARGGLERLQPIECGKARHSNPFSCLFQIKFFDVMPQSTRLLSPLARRIHRSTQTNTSNSHLKGSSHVGHHIAQHAPLTHQRCSHRSCAGLGSLLPFPAAQRLGATPPRTRGNALSHWDKPLDPKAQPMLIYSSRSDIQEKLAKGRALRSQAWIGLLRTLLRAPRKALKLPQAKPRHPADTPPPGALPV